MATMTLHDKQSLGPLLDQHHSLRLMRMHLEKQLREINARIAELEAAISTGKADTESAEQDTATKEV